MCLEQGIECINIAMESRRVDGAVCVGVCLGVLWVDGGREGGVGVRKDGGVRSGGNLRMPPTYARVRRT